MADGHVVTTFKQIGLTTGTRRLRLLLNLSKVDYDPFMCSKHGWNLSRIPGYKRLQRWCAAARMLLGAFKLLYSLALCLMLANTVFANHAEVVSVQGRAELRGSDDSVWRAASVGQRIMPGGLARTGPGGQMALLLADRTQLRLDQNAQVQLRELGSGTQSQSSLRLEAGRSWANARPPSATPPSVASTTPSQSTRVSVQTPSASLSIRGTSWMVSVDSEGKTNVLVLDGEVDLSNPQGQGILRITRGEAASVAIGALPQRLIVTNPLERVQWVSAWRLNPRRWLGNTPWQQRPYAIVQAVALIDQGDVVAAKALLEAQSDLTSELLLADIAMFLGDLDAVQARLTPWLDAQGFESHFPLPEPSRARSHMSWKADDSLPLSASAMALWAKVLLAQGRAQDAQIVLSQALSQNPQALALWLQQAHTALFEGNLKLVRDAIAHALKLDAGDAEGWWLLGVVECERENYRAAEVALSEALRLEPSMAQAHAELGTLFTISGKLGLAERSFNEALRWQADALSALTGRGMLRLKQGKEQAALEDFLRAGVIEPRYARAWFYAALAYYQLGDFPRTEQALERLRELDPNDPLAPMLQSLLALDRLDYTQAIDAASQAQRRIGFLKSLNPIQANQKGSANLGSARAAFGLEDWAQFYAASLAGPWWATSHFFQSDRQTSGFVKNAYLYQGFITDPLSFGASPKRTSLITSEGHYQRIDRYQEWADWQQTVNLLTFNGLWTAETKQTESELNSFLAGAYFLNLDRSEGGARRMLPGVTPGDQTQLNDRDRAQGESTTLGLGLQVNQQARFFLFHTDTHLGGLLQNTTLKNAQVLVDDRRSDFGLNLRVDSTHQWWFKSGSGNQNALVSGLVAIPQWVALEGFQTQARQQDIEIRQALALSDTSWISWGALRSRYQAPASFAIEPSASVLLRIEELKTLQIDQVYAMLHQQVRSTLQSEFLVMQQRLQLLRLGQVNLSKTVVENSQTTQRASKPLAWFGTRWQIHSAQSLTMAAQQWRRPASAGGLAPVDLLGIPINDRLVSAGGFYERLRIQSDWEQSSSLFVNLFLDSERVANVSAPSTSVVPSLDLSQLEGLRQRRDVFTSVPEFEETPAFLLGRVRSAGLAINQLVSHRQSFSMGYRYREAEQEGERAGLRIPWVPRHWVRLSSQWQLPSQILVGIAGTWRSSRYQDEENNPDLIRSPGWQLAGIIFWESSDKRYRLQTVVDRIRIGPQDPLAPKARLLSRASLQF